ncbi:AAA family ATPase, partial [Clostridium perfringens]|nr:AAA family ATPase [Clostridium perfringens]
MEEKFIKDIASRISDGIIILNSNNKVIYANNYVRKALSIESIDLEKVEISTSEDADKNT